jgi:polyphosphate kinase 2 (PPK2 family)
VVKIMLNLSRREQANRFVKRIDHPEKNWKLSASDVRERHCWTGYQPTFDAMLTATSTRGARWYVVSADHKWFTRLATAAIVLQILRTINPEYPAAAERMARARAGLVAELASWRAA